MKFIDGEGELTILVEDRTPIGVQGAGDFALRTKLAIRNVNSAFSADTRCWISKESFTTFLRDFKKFEETLEGKAELDSMSPGEFWISFKRYSAAGQVMAEGQVGRHWPENPKMMELYFRFNIDQTFLKKYLSEFETWAE
jgi:hypothetical protein